MLETVWGGTILIGYGSYIQIGENARLELNDCFINREVKIICNKEILIGKGTIIGKRPKMTYCLKP